MKLPSLNLPPIQLPVVDRPLISRWTIGAWIVLLAMLPDGLRSYYLNSRIGVFTWEPGSLMGINYHTFHHAAERARNGLWFYEVPPPDGPSWAEYLYPPISVLAYYPFTVFGWETGYALLTALSVLASVGATWLIVRYVESLGVSLGWLDALLVLAAFVLSTHAFGTVYFGNINLLLAFAFVLGFWLLRSDREGAAGTVFAVAALFKIFPALVGLWLLRRRAVGAIGAALATGIGGLVLGAILFGFEKTRFYFTDVMTGRVESESFVGGYPIDGTTYITIQQPTSNLIAAVWPNAPYEVILGASVLGALAILGYFYYDIQTELDRQMAIFATFVVTVVLIPSLRWYLVLLFLPIVSLLYLWRDGPARYVFLAGGILFSLTLPQEEAVELAAGLPGLLSAVVRPITATANLPLIGILVMLAACAWQKSRTGEKRRAPSERPDHPQYEQVDL